MVLYLSVKPETLLHRALMKYGHPDYWESDVNVCISSDMFDSFRKYRAELKAEFDVLAAEYGFDVIDGEKSPDDIQAYLWKKISRIL